MKKFMQADKQYDVICLGRVTIDLNPNEINRTLDKTKSFNMYLGGSPGNVSIGLSRLGNRVGFIGKVSNDQFGTFIIDKLNSENVDTSHVIRSNGRDRLGLTFTEMKSETESSILMYRNEASDLKLSTEEIDEEYIKQTRVLLISGTALSESPSREATLKAMYLAKKHGVAIVFDIDYRSYNWKNEDEISIYYTTVARNSDLIIGSREEFDLTGRLLGLAEKTDKEVATYWMEHGEAEIVIIKHGKKGSCAFDDSGNEYVVPSYPAKVLKSFGGGDAHGSALLTCLLKGYLLEKALHYASASASINIGSHSCSESLPTLEEIEKAVEKANLYNR
ncbi:MULTISPECIES: 5-dehydro-2-deoxygluconokinase [unclassified Gemella]|uniref:5-dehydro-2-deoxygluconokinase n=1 Tax=unclassified Gemella TaxID=2624949 RepID=UPI001C0517C9|nr:MULTISPECIES: 5-dehydro-2-deoxygluconokinase [unclassified Gemella]MBU0278241.1 5-dehydro-2-deoxygluconokinase [Gemella sp. zg-1178]QWQ38803.1 5-dehydro-2-deoxygluconokinase [Gemella sp. zg-570]